MTKNHNLEIKKYIHFNNNADLINIPLEFWEIIQNFPIIKKLLMSILKHLVSFLKLYVLMNKWLYIMGTITLSNLSEENP